MRLVRADEAARRRMLRQRAQRRRRSFARFSVSIMLLSMVAVTANALRPLPLAALDIDTAALNVPAEQTQLAWPTKGQAALMASEYGLLGTYGSNEPIPTASIAKVLTALCVLERHPLAVGEQGPTITFSRSDVALYQYQLTQNGSNVPIYEGSQMTLYQALEAIMIPSANNVADSLAIWAFGSLEAYAAYANEYALRNQLINTRVGSDASGLDNSTVSTASDVARLASLAREHEVIMEIAGKTSTILPTAGTVYNYNTALGKAGVTGLKTGNNDGNKGALAFTANVEVGDRSIEISGAVMGQDSLNAAITQSISLVESIAQNFERREIVSSSAVLGYATTEWGSTATVIASKPVEIVRWKGSAITTKYTAHSVTAIESGTIGAIEIKAGATSASVSLEIGETAIEPDFWWRATRVPTV